MGFIKNLIGGKINNGYEIHPNGIKTKTLSGFSGTQNKDYRKHTKFHLTTHGDREIMSNLRSFRVDNPLYKVCKTNPMGETADTLLGQKIYQHIYDFTGKTIEIREQHLVTPNFNGNTISVFVRGLRLGTSYNPDQRLLDALHHDKIESVYLMVEGGKFKIIEGDWKWFRSEDGIKCKVFVKIAD